MKKIALIILLVIPFAAFAQRMELYTYNNVNYIALYAYGLQREVVKTNSEMKASQMNGDGTGVVRRHHTTKGKDAAIGDDGYNSNEKISFAFIVAPYNVDVKGNHTHKNDSDKDGNSPVKLTWTEASGWDPSIEIETGNYDLVSGKGNGASPIATQPTGCAAYKGMNGTDEEGDWRLPTQREMQIMFTVIEQTLDYINSNAVTHEIVEGGYWTSTEFCSPGTIWNSWSISSITGHAQNEPRRDAWGKSPKNMVRCVKDIYEPIND